jgi:hypothetical protein
VVPPRDGQLVRAGPGTELLRQDCDGSHPQGVDRLLIRTATAARAGMATTADISTRVHPTKGRGKRIPGSRCRHQHQPWSITPTDPLILTAHTGTSALGSPNMGRPLYVSCRGSAVSPTGWVTRSAAAVTVGSVGRYLAVLLDQGAGCWRRLPNTATSGEGVA